MVHTGETLVSTPAERYLLVYMIGVILIVSTLIIVFFIVFQKRKNKLLQDKLMQQKLFEEEISKTQIEIQEQTLKNIGQDLHDNVGQLLSVANMQLSVLAKQVGPELELSFIESKDLVKESLQELRLLSKSLNSDVIAHRGFQESINTEMERFNKLELILAELTVEGNSNLIKNSKDSIILFRIFQEFFSNTIKYSEASLLKVHVNYTSEYAVITASDNGIGFDVKRVKKGSGLINMKSRAMLIEAQFKMVSKPKEGVSLTVTYPYRNEYL
ncbi:two-component system sensor histidine kinase [Formosa agariphila KMM 3901]|uniref:histidine kinase n=1 Tax=Formosa agariphila (strain DSM 15362 / KCTC 12365 / LMG 23005 / KMM 3901 / M-2Alg 35-1) TaxID=1347342 RepID=T2KNV3_FORAG|nr:histidine kinase [Formosa agariphila]CDF80131.1 two-component system sensor histidine kinase [Formosa agariphila KMM 3901]